ncbi:DUF4214 domain-containing protein [Methylobacterium planeticum]|uniref:DUF4214 domain-containing protein n=1 Tax=Methylobacterium planeticum TaxID=2615211 RepID=A0A6N6MM18_9HYPH|nr:DUF4214 domain-containing protein [Methylobacterium planeticum]KAB1070026.1 DUF4214 domain-containing protein [Methylobacterium planeticum]
MALSADQLNTIYQNVLFRNVDTGGIQFFANRTDISDAQVRQQIELSAEATTFVTPVVRLYQEVLGRVPDAAGLRFFSTELRQGFTLDQITQQFLGSTEYQAKTSGVTGQTNSDAFVTSAFQSILGRTPATSELPYFRTLTASNALAQIANSPEASQFNAANVTTFLDNVAQGTYTTGSLGSQSGGTTGGTNAGTSFVLTTGIDTGTAFTGGAGNDTFTGAVNTNGGGGATDTFNNGDSLNGGAGTDKLTLFTTGNIPTGGTTTNIEQIFIQNTTNASSISANQFTGATQFWAQSSTADQTFTDLNVAQTAGIKGTVGANVNLTFTYANVAGTADTASLALDAAKLTGTSTVTVAGIETLNVSGVGTGINITDTDLKTLNISATGTTSITANGSANLTTINASASTGNVTVTATNAAAVAFTGGAGNDKLVLGGTLTNADVINGGAGTDTVSISGGDFRTAGGDVIKGVNTLASIEQLEFTGATGAQVNGDTFTNAAITKLIFNTTGNDVVELSGARTYAFGSDNAGNATFTARAGATTLNLALEGTDVNALGTAGTAQAGTIVANGQTQINLASSGVAGVGANVVGELDLASNTTVTVTGSQALTISALKTVAGADFAATDTGGIINAGSFTGKLTVVGSAGVDVITVGTGGSVVTGGTGADQITFGSGVDTANFTSGTSESGVLAAGVVGQIDVISSFTAGAGGDHLAVTGGGAVVNTYTAVTAAQQTTIGAAASLTAAINAAADAHAAAGWTAFSYGGDTYALHEAATSTTTGYIAGDNVVKLTGVTVANLTAANFGPVA